jgi:hypothetical protein
MTYLGYLITYDHSAPYKVYRVEGDGQTFWFGNFCRAILFVRSVWTQLHFKVGMKYRTINDRRKGYRVLTSIGEKFITVTYCYPNGMQLQTSGNKAIFLKYLFRSYKFITIL